MFAAYKLLTIKLPVTETFPSWPVIFAVVTRPFVLRAVRLPSEVMSGWAAVETVP